MFFALFGVFLLFLAFFRNRPFIRETFNFGVGILTEILNFGFGIYTSLSKFIKNGLLILREIWKIGIEIYLNPVNVSKIFKNAFKRMFSTFKRKTKKEKRIRKYIKIRSRRAQNRNVNNRENKMDYLKPTGIFKSCEGHVEKVRSGRKGKIILFLEILKIEYKK